MENSKDSISVNYAILINAQINEVFPLACPVMEYKWINGWKCELINCPNGYVELGCVFNEIMSAPIFHGNSYGKTTWTAIKNDTANFQRHYELKNKVSTSLIKIEMFPESDSYTRVTWKIIYHANTKRGEKLIKNDLSKKMNFLVSMLGNMLKFYCENGRIMPTSEIIEFSKKADFFTFADKYRMVLNKIAMTMMRDDDRKRFIAGKPISKIISSENPEIRQKK